MPAPTVEELLTLLTEEEIKAKLLSFVSAGGFPVNSWATTSVPRALIAGDSHVVKVLTDQVPAIVKGGTLRDSSGKWTDLKLTDFQIERIPAKRTQRQLRLTDTGGGPVPLAPDSVIVESAAGLRYVLKSGAAVPGGGGFVDAIFEAEDPGDEYNAATSGWSFVTVVPGVAITEPVLTLTAQGADEEIDDSAKQRGRAMFPGLGGGANDPVYEKWAREAAPGDVTRVAIRRHYPAPGELTIVLAGAGGAVAGSVVTAVDNYVKPRAPNNIDPYAVSAVNRVIAITGTVFFLAAESTAEAKGEAALNDLAKVLKIGSGLPLDLITKALRAGLSDHPSNDVDLTSPTVDVVPGAYNEVIVFDLTGLVWTAV